MTIVNMVGGGASSAPIEFAGRTRTVNIDDMGFNNDITMVTDLEYAADGGNVIRASARNGLITGPSTWLTWNNYTISSYRLEPGGTTTHLGTIVATMDLGTSGGTMHGFFSDNELAFYNNGLIKCNIDTGECEEVPVTSNASDTYVIEGRLFRCTADYESSTSVSFTLYEYRDSAWVSVKEYLYDYSPNGRTCDISVGGHGYITLDMYTSSMKHKIIHLSINDFTTAVGGTASGCETNRFFMDGLCGMGVGNASIFIPDSAGNGIVNASGVYGLFGKWTNPTVGIRQTYGDVITSLAITYGSTYDTLVGFSNYDQEDRVFAFTNYDTSISRTTFVTPDGWVYINN